MTVEELAFAIRRGCCTAMRNCISTVIEAVETHIEHVIRILVKAHIFPELVPTIHTKKNSPIGRFLSSVITNVVPWGSGLDIDPVSHSSQAIGWRRRPARYGIGMG